MLEPLLILFIQLILRSRGIRAPAWKRPVVGVRSLVERYSHQVVVARRVPRRIEHGRELHVLLRSHHTREIHKPLRLRVMMTPAHHSIARTRKSHRLLHELPDVESSPLLLLPHDEQLLLLLALLLRQRLVMVMLHQPVMLGQPLPLLMLLCLLLLLLLLLHVLGRECVRKVRVRESLLSGGSPERMEGEQAHEEVGRHARDSREALMQRGRAAREPSQVPSPPRPDRGELNVVPRRRPDDRKHALELRRRPHHAAFVGVVVLKPLRLARGDRIAAEREERSHDQMWGDCSLLLPLEELAKDATRAPNVHARSEIIAAADQLRRTITRSGDDAGELR
mmetsp:Transcript_25230/g.82841  ORF Transcript_25230/g.82841 Transcript_25230/m.82841 type:complete len:337 (+) Transcript_25230:1514-2524(+)